MQWTVCADLTVGDDSRGLKALFPYIFLGMCCFCVYHDSYALCVFLCFVPHISSKKNGLLLCILYDVYDLYVFSYS